MKVDSKGHLNLCPSIIENHLRKLDYYTHPVICFTDDKELDAQQIETEETPSGKIPPASTMQFPNDLIVQYIKELNEQYHTLTERSRRALKKVEALPAYKSYCSIVEREI